MRVKAIFGHEPTSCSVFTASRFQPAGAGSIDGDVRTRHGQIEPRAHGLRRIEFALPLQTLHQPVQALATKRTYVLRRFLDRHLLATGAVIAAVAALVALSISLAVQSERAEAEALGLETPEGIRRRFEKMPTSLSIAACDADLVERAAHALVHQALNEGEAGRWLRESGFTVPVFRHEP